MPKVVHFEIIADNTARARTFYESVFDWKITKWDAPQEYWMCDGGEGDGINGALMPKFENLTGTINTIAVDSVERYIEKVTANGGKVITQVMDIPQVGLFAYCMDTEGNVFGIIQFTNNQ